MKQQYCAADIQSQLQGISGGYQMMVHRHSRISILFASLICVLLTIAPAYALEFTPTESEWLAWPDYCRARYVASGAGIGSSFEFRVTAAEASRHEAEIGDEAWYWLHHYCAALVYLSRAAAEVDDARTKYWLSEAEANIMGHYRRISKGNPMFPDVAVGIAQLYRQRGDRETALRYLNESMEVQPQASSPYALAAIICKDAGDLEGAVAVLLRGNSALGGESAELHYFLGLVYIDLGDLDSAVKHATRAYDLGYPLPGLSAKLRRLGHPIE